MNSAYIYLQLYRMFDENTPIPVDCGKLCNAACCSGDDSGMFLFPGEKEVFKLLKPSGFRIEYSDLTYNDGGIIRKTPIIFCEGNCDRYVRPLACRIFPLTPVIDKNGKIEIITDPRAKSICPLAKTFYLSEYDENFLKAVKKAFTLLSKNKHVMAFLYEYTDYINEFRRFFA
ncbi:MAG: hypothetical protein J1G06_05370 [Oscillospiraceae bacterium]|nr:hypothetical protein [Oscillospiraceae bacterium]